MGTPASTSARPPPPPAPPRISLAVLAANEQRFYLCALLLLTAALKLHSFIVPQPAPPLWLLLAPSFFNTWQDFELVRWGVIDLGVVLLVRWLRVPRLAWGPIAATLIGVGLLLVDYGLFGRWELRMTDLLPSFISSWLISYLDLDEQSVTLAKVLASQTRHRFHLGGQHTVHILAHSTAQLNPAAGCYCVSSPSSATAQPILIPILLNNTQPHSLTYSLSPLPGSSAESEPRQITIPASALVRPSKAPQQLDSALEVDDSLPAWLGDALAPQSSAVVRHPLPGKADPNALSASESIVYLPIKEPGIVHLVSFLDKSKRPVRIKRTKENPGTMVVACPEAGFVTSTQEVHTCLASNGVVDTRSLELQVRGYEPLSLKWRATFGQANAQRVKVDSLDGIRLGSSTAEEEGRIALPAKLSLAGAGTQSFALESVADGCGNKVAFPLDAKPSHGLLPGSLPSRSFIVHSPPSVLFSGACGRGQEIALLKGGKASLELRLNNIDEELAARNKARYEGRKRADETWQVGVRFTSPDGQKSERAVTMHSANTQIQVDQAGEYEIASVKGKWCEGAVLSPNLCSVALQPQPELLASFTPLLDGCNSEVGLTASLHLSGLPPYRLHYTLTQLSPVRRVTSHPVVALTSAREELTLRPPGPGEWEYKFTKLEDGRYKGQNAVELDENAPGMKRTQRVQLVAEAKWSERHRTVRSCEGDKMTVSLELKGEPPYEVKYAIVGQPVQTIKDIKSARHSFEIDVPEKVNHFALSLESIKDGLGCTRPLTAADLAVDVKRSKPSARLHGTSAERKVMVKHSERAHIPLRLSGEGPWKVTYLPPALPGRKAKPVEVTAHGLNAELTLTNPIPGTYKLLDVRDQYCPGEVSEVEWSVGVLPRPTLQWAEGLGQVQKDGSILRAGVCEGVRDSVQVVFDGKAPYKATYQVRRSPNEQPISRSLASNVNDNAEITLNTLNAGRHSYFLTGVADANYVTPASQGLIAPAGGRDGVLRLDQEVFAAPNVAFKSGPKADFCLHDSLASRSSDELVLKLEGQAPWKVEMAVKQEGKGEVKRFTVDVLTRRWPLQLPFELSKAVKHDITLLSVSDANGCSRTLDPNSPAILSTVSLAVAEVATISAADPSYDHCVGDFLDFDIKGSGPFTVTTDFRNKKHVVPIVTGHQFRRLADEPGLFKLVSIASGAEGHQCKSTDVGLEKFIHHIPSAAVGDGDGIITDLQEGEQTEIVFTFKGTPPYSFTYQRTRPITKSKDRKVLETHTVQGVMESTYSIYTKEEGTWSVTRIEDKWCEYPPPKEGERKKKRAIKASSG